MKSPWLTVSEVAKKLGTHRDTVYGWMHHGVLRPVLGERVMLRAEKVGGKYKTRRLWLREFLDALKRPNFAAPPTPTAEERMWAVDREEFRRLLGGKRRS